MASGETDWPLGLWINDLRFEELAVEDSTPPYATLWLSSKSNVDLDCDAARRTIDAEAKELLTSEELKQIEGADEKGVLLWLPAPSKRQILDAIADGDGELFVRLFVSRFDMMAKFVPVQLRLARH